MKKNITNNRRMRKEYERDTKPGETSDHQSVVDDEPGEEDGSDAEAADSGDDGNSNSSSSTPWRTVLQQWLKRLFPRSTLSAPSTASAAVCSLTTILLLVAYWARRRRRNCRRLNDDNQSNPNHSKLSTKSPVVPLSILLAAVEQGRLLKALLGTSRVVFQTQDINGTQNTTSSSIVSEETTSWKQTLLPSNNEILKKHIVSSLTRESSKPHSNLELGVLSETDYGALTTTVFAALPFVYLALVYRMMRDQSNQLGGINDKSSSGNNSSTSADKVGSPMKTFADVAGLDSAVLEMSEIVDYLKNPQRYQKYGASAPRGVLLYGPPGTGKTLLAQAVYGEVLQSSQSSFNAAATTVFVACSASDFVELYVGRGAARVRTLFSSARDQARARWRHRRRHGQNCPSFYVAPWQWIQHHVASIASTGGGGGSSLNVDGKSTNGDHGQGTSSRSSTGSTTPCCSAIIFIDELDALAKTRSHGLGHSNDEREQTLNQLLIEMDGFESGNNKKNTNDWADSDIDDENVTIVVIAATNRADVLDPAVVRRFDRHIQVGYPNSVAARRAILLVHARGILMSSSPLDDETGNESTIDWTKLASDEVTGHMSGSDLRNVVNEAALLAVRDDKIQSSLTTTNAANRAVGGVSQHHLEEAARKIRQTKTAFLQR